MSQRVNRESALRVDKNLLHTVKKDKFINHYQNGIEMGFMKSKQKNGRALMFEDDGMSVILNYQSSNIDGDALFITKQGALISVLYKYNLAQQLVYKYKDRILYVKYVNGIPEGKGIIINFNRRQLMYLIYTKGILLQKTQQTDVSIVQQVIENRNLQYLIPKKHLKILNLQGLNTRGFQIVKKGSKVTIGFTGINLFDGLSLTMAIKSFGQDDMEILLLERGYYIQSLLFDIGQRRFQNSNIYVGQFKNDVFQGTGLLVNFKKGNWIKGYFKDGNLIQMIDGDDNIKQNLIKENLQLIRRTKQNYLNQSKVILNLDQIYDLLRKIESHKHNYGIKSLEERKQAALKKIRDSFINEDTPIKIQDFSKSPNQNGFRQIKEFAIQYDNNNKLKFKQSQVVTNNSQKVNQVGFFEQFINQFKSDPAPKQSKKNEQSIKSKVPYRESSSPKKNRIFTNTQSLKFPAATSRYSPLRQTSLSPSRKNRIFNAMPDTSKITKLQQSQISSTSPSKKKKIFDNQPRNTYSPTPEKINSERRYTHQIEEDKQIQDHQRILTSRLTNTLKSKIFEGIKEQKKQLQSNQPVFKYVYSPPKNR